MHYVYCITNIVHDGQRNLRATLGGGVLASLEALLRLNECLKQGCVEWTDEFVDPHVLTNWMCPLGKCAILHTCTVQRVIMGGSKTYSTCG